MADDRFPAHSFQYVYYNGYECIPDRCGNGDGNFCNASDEEQAGSKSVLLFYCGSDDPVLLITQSVRKADEGYWAYGFDSRDLYLLCGKKYSLCGISLYGIYQECSRRTGGISGYGRMQSVPDVLGDLFSAVEACDLYAGNSGYDGDLERFSVSAADPADEKASDADACTVCVQKRSEYTVEFDICKLSVVDAAASACVFCAAEKHCGGDCSRRGKRLKNYKQVCATGQRTNKNL